MNDPHQPSAMPRPVGHAPSTHPAAPGIAPRPSAAPVTLKPKDDFTPVALADEAPSAHAPVQHHKIMAFGPQNELKEKEYKRPTTITGRGAVRVRTFHGHMSDDGLRRLDEKINDFLEAHPQFEVKFATTTVGVWDGKTKEPALLINLWC